MNDIHLNDLSATQRFLLKLCAENPEFQYSGNDYTQMNTLASWKVVTDLSNRRFKLTSLGELLYNEHMSLFGLSGNGHPEEFTSKAVITPQGASEAPVIMEALLGG